MARRHSTTSGSNQLLVLGDTLRLTNTTADADIPINHFTYTLVNAPDGMGIAASSGLLTWTPQPDQAPSTNPITVRVADDGSPPQSDETLFSAVVIPLPSLTIASSGSNRVVVSWPALASQAGFSLTTATNLNLPIPWTPVTDPTTTIGDRDIVTNSLNEALRVFRLRRP